MEKTLNSKKLYRQYKWQTLIVFGLLYNLVYLGRFNVTNLMPKIAEAIGIMDGQQTIIENSIFVSYAIGSLINGYLADRWGGKLAVTFGASASVVVNLLMATSSNWQGLVVLSSINGYFQSMIWVGGINIIANWWNYNERGKGAGFANFFSGLSHVTAYLIPAFLAAYFINDEWRTMIILPMLIMCVFIAIFVVYSVGSPKEKGLEPYESEDWIITREIKLQRMTDNRKNPYSYFLKRKNFVWWCGIAVLSSLCRYGLLKWIPVYYSVESDKEILNHTFSNLTLPIGMAVGTLTITWIGGSLLHKNKGLVIVGSAALCGALIFIFPMLTETATILTGIFFTGFFLYGINGMLWIYAMDEGCRHFSGTTAGILNCCAYVGAALEIYIFPYILEVTGQIISIFLIMELICISMIICGMVVCKKNTVIEPEVRE